LYAHTVRMRKFQNPENWLTRLIVLPEGPEAIVGQELGGAYFEKAGPEIERQVAKAGFRMAAWLDAIVKAYPSALEDEMPEYEMPEDQISEEL
jgi:hypothetical protein